MCLVLLKDLQVRCNLPAVRFSKVGFLGMLNEAADGSL
jgi:hypothetical protein